MARLGRRLRLLSAISEWHFNRMPLFPRQGRLYGPVIEIRRVVSADESYITVVRGRMECVRARRWLFVPPIYEPFENQGQTYALPPRTFNCRCVITEAKP